MVCGTTPQLSPLWLLSLIMPIIITPYETTHPTDIPSYSDISLDVSMDHAVYDNLVDAWLNRRVEGDTFAIPKCRFVSRVGQNASNVHHHAALEAEHSDGVYTVERGTWLFPKIYVPASVIPLVGDTITGAGYEWTILNVNRPLHNSCWTLLVNRLFFNLPLASSINYYSVETDVDSYGSRVLTKNKIFENLTCAFQPMTQTEEIKNNRIYYNTEYLVYVEEDLKARTGDIVELIQTETYESMSWQGFNDLNWSQYGNMEFYTPSKYYKITNIENRKRIDDLTRLTVRELVNSEEIE